MPQDKRLPFCLFLLRATVFLVMLVWTIDKFINPAHAAAVYQTFYFLDGLGREIMFVLGAIELVILIGFVLGVKKRLTYGLVLLFHGVSTLSSYKQYMAPYDGANILFFAAWPMLAACVALYLLRNEDTMLTLGSS